MVGNTSFEEIRRRSIESAKQKVKESVSRDQMVINAINNVEELDKSINVLSARLREWFALKNPELERHLTDNEEFVKVVLVSADEPTIMGAKLEEDDDHAIKAMAVAAQGLIETKYFLLLYLEKVMGQVCRNVLVLAGPTIGAKLLREAKSLKRLASLQSSTIQLLGAEKALFRHIKTGSRPPKYGYIVNHPVVTAAKKEDRGKAARALADKLSIAARLDYFKGEFLAESLLRDLEKRFKA
jgi:nucleolar protein 56